MNPLRHNYITMTNINVTHLCPYFIGYTVSWILTVTFRLMNPKRIYRYYDMRNSVPDAGNQGMDKNYIIQCIVGYDYSSMPYSPASGIKVLILPCAQILVALWHTRSSMTHEYSCRKMHKIFILCVNIIIASCFYLLLSFIHSFVYLL